MKSELISKRGTMKKSESPTGIEPMTSQTLGRCSIHWAMRTHGQQGHFKCLYGQQVLLFWYLYNEQTGIPRKKTRQHFNALKSGVKVPASATPNEVDRESVQKKSLGF